MTEEPIIFVVEDEEAVRLSLKELLEAANYRVEPHGDAESFCQSFVDGTPGCLILDVRLPGMSGLELQELLAQRGMDIPLVFVTGHADIPMAVQGLQGGAVDFLEKPCRAETLVPCIQSALSKDERTRTRSLRLSESRSLLDGLTSREREVFELLAEGCGVKQVAYRLYRSIKTIDNHKTNLMGKLGVHDRIELLRLAVRAGVIRLEPSR